MSRLRTLLLIGILVYSLVASTLGLTGADQDWEVVGTGIEYREFELPDPNNVFVARMERNNPNVIIESSIAQGRLSGGKETVSSMAERYEQALNYWGGASNPTTWGLRNDVVVAINGSFYDKTTGVPYSGQIHAGWYAKRFDDLGGSSGFAWKLDRQAFIGECVDHRPEKQYVVYLDSGIEQPIDLINAERDDNKLVLYTPQFDSTTLTDDTGVEVLVEITRPTMILPEPAYALGYVREIQVAQGSIPIPFDHIVLSANGTASDTLMANVSIGSLLGISQEITHYEQDCETLSDQGWTKTYASVSGSFYFLKDSEIQQFSDPGALERHPRTAVAFDDTYLFFIVVDGRDSLHSIGMTIQEVALFARDTLSATYGIAQDGGGSSTMVVNGEVKNNVFCNNTVCNYEFKTFLPVVEGEGQLPPESVRALDPGLSADYQRLVANGLMMVVVEPWYASDAFLPGDVVTTTAPVAVRLGPGTQYAALTTVLTDTRGVVLDPLNDLSGVLAKYQFWWKVSFPEASGWVPQDFLVGPPERFRMQVNPITSGNWVDWGWLQKALLPDRLR
jgi:hypothetical protein